MMDLNFTNYTRFGIHNSAEKYTWVSFRTFAILSSLIGDSIILVASTKYNALKLHKTIVAIMQHIAVCDLIISLNLILFVSSLIAERNILGEFLCYTRAYLTFYTFPVSFFLTAALASCKVFLIKFPLRERWTKKRAHMLCVAIWICSLLIPFLLLIVDRDDVRFDYREYSCHYAFSSDDWKLLRPIVGIFTSLLPNAIVIVTSVWLIMEARKVAKRWRDSIRWQGLMTVILTAGVYCISVLPIQFYHLVGHFVQHDPQGMFHVYFYRFSIAVVGTNVMSNFYIYSLTVSSFRSFLLSRITALWRTISCRGKISQQRQMIICYILCCRITNE